MNGVNTLVAFEAHEFDNSIVVIIYQNYGDFP